MLDDIILQADDSTPIYQQLEQQILRFIAAGRLKPGEPLPSVRAIAAAIAVNPMTVSKAVSRLAEDGWLVHRRGKPTCVADPLPMQTMNIDAQLQTELQRLIQHAKQLRLSKTALKKLFEQHW